MSTQRSPGFTHTSPYHLLTNTHMLYFRHKAIDDACQALDHDSTCCGALLHRARSYVQVGDLAEAVSDFERCLATGLFSIKRAYVYIHIYMYMHIYTYIELHMYIHVYTCIHIRTHLNMYTLSDASQLVSFQKGLCIYICIDMYM